MADAMNFGPEWLRNLSSEGTTSGAPKYQLAEHRYGREEMLALFDRNAKPPESLTRMPEIFVEKIQVPAAIYNMTEDELRLWNRGINSDTVLRLNGKVPAGPPGMMRGRGTSVDRGRGRGRGAPSGFYYNRGNYDDGEEGGTYLRQSRSFDRTQMGERAWPERNGAEPTDWNGSTSPRKDHAMRGGPDTWRRNRDDEEGWRSREKWNRTSWREDGGEGPGSGGRTGNWGRGWVEEGHHNRRNAIDEVPEWATADSHEPSGSFDASGAFHGYSSDEVEGQPESPSIRRVESARAKLFSDGSGEPKKAVSSNISSGTESARRKESESEAPGGLTRSKTAVELGPAPGQPVAPSAISKSASSATLSEFQVLDRIRTQHQNFVTKSTEPEPVEKKKMEKSPSNKPLSQQQPPLEQPPPSPSIAQVSPPILKSDGPTIKTQNVAGSRNRNNEDQGVLRQGSEEDMTRLLTVNSVVRLIDESEPPKPPQTTPNSMQSTASESDRWFYRDPQGNEQGPFLSSEMLSWYSSGYFLTNLLVRRETDNTYYTLGDLMLRNGGTVPFSSPPAPPIRTPAATDPFNPFLLQQQLQQQKVLQSLTQDPDLWKSFTPSQREAIVTQRLLQPPAPAPTVPNPYSQAMAPALAHFIHQFQQSNQGPQDMSLSDPVRAMMLMNQPAPPAAHHLPIPVMPHMPPPTVPHQFNDIGLSVTEKQEGLRKAAGISKTEPQQPSQRSPVDSLWSGPGRPITWANGLTAPTNTPLWNTKTETELLAEQQKQLLQRAEEEKQKEEKRRLEELRKKEEERRELEEAEEQRRRAEERRRVEEEEKRRVEQEETLRREKEEKERKKLEETKKKEEKRKEEAKRLEEIRRKEEEKERRRQAAAEEKRRQEEERQRLEMEAENRRREEIAQQQEQQRRQEEALRCLKEQQQRSRKPWTQNTLTPASLSEIQAQEKEKKWIQLQKENSIQEMLNAQAIELQARENDLQNSRSNGFNLKWAEQPPQRRDNIKSLAEIQAEEQKQLMKQRERDMEERQIQQRDIPVTAGIWGSASGLSWANQNNGSSPWGGVTPSPPATSGFWDDATAAVTKSPVKSKPQANASVTKKQTKTSSKSKPAAKRDEVAVLELFKKSQQGDEFTSWCNATLHSMQTSIDVPTFVGFLREIDNPFEVKDYVKQYLGETSDAAQFANQFLERRSRWKAAQKSSIEEDDMCAPAAAINPTSATTESAENAKKGNRKAKKGKMMKVDSRILGFNVTAAQNRINVGQRETWDPNS